MRFCISEVLRPLAVEKVRGTNEMVHSQAYRAQHTTRKKDSSIPRFGRVSAVVFFRTETAVHEESTRTANQSDLRKDLDYY